jgi:hypothetical protein
MPIPKAMFMSPLPPELKNGMAIGTAWVTKA